MKGIPNIANSQIYQLLMVALNIMSVEQLGIFQTILRAEFMSIEETKRRQKK